MPLPRENDRFWRYMDEARKALAGSNRESVTEAWAKLSGYVQIGDLSAEHKRVARVMIGDLQRRSRALKK